MSAYKVGDKVYIPSHPEIVDATITAVDFNGVELDVISVEKYHGIMSCGFHVIKPLKSQKKESRTIKYCPYCGEEIDIKD